MEVRSRAGQFPAWKLEDAKARFSEVVRLARENGPQRVSVRGRDAVVVLSAADYARLVPPPAEVTLADVFGRLPRTSHIDADFDRVSWQENVSEPPEF